MRERTTKEVCELTFANRIRKGGDRGPAIVPSRPQASVLLAAISHADADLKMPPKGPKLADSIIDDFRKWIEMGAPDPRAGNRKLGRTVGRHRSREKDIGLTRPPSPTEAPDVKDDSWPRDDVDRFVLSALSKEGLDPVARRSTANVTASFAFRSGRAAAITGGDRSLSDAIDARGIEVAMQSEVD